MSQWLVRTAKNVLSGPYPKETLSQMVLSGELSSQDEVCENGHYWIYLHEREEVARQLGINLPKPPKNPDEETTETQTQTQTQTETDMLLSGERTPPGMTHPMSVTAAATAEAIEAAACGDDEESTLVMGKGNGGGARPKMYAAPLETAPATAASEGAALPAADSARDLAAQPEASPKSPPGPTVVYRPMVLGEIERPSAWRMAIWILIVAAFFLAFWMLRALRR
jgi:hypothetical protein